MQRTITINKHSRRLKVHHCLRSVNCHFATRNLPNTADIFGTHVGQLSCNYPLLADGLPCKICEIASDWATIEYTGDIEEPVEVAIRQQQFAISPFDIAKQLTEYWSPIWQGDEPAQDLFDDSHILDLVQTLPPHPDIDTNMLDTESWPKAIHKLKHKAARALILSLR